MKPQSMSVPGPPPWAQPVLAAATVGGEVGSLLAARLLAVQIGRQLSFSRAVGVSMDRPVRSGHQGHLPLYETSHFKPRTRVMGGAGLNIVCLQHLCVFGEALGVAYLHTYEKYTFI